MYILESNMFIVPVLYVKKEDLEIIASTTREELFIGLSLPSTTLPRWLDDKESMEKAAKERGVKLETAIADNTLELQSKQIDALITKGIKVLIIITTSSAGIAPVIEKAKNAGIKIIAYVRPILNSDVDLYVGNDNLKLGEMQGNFLVQNVPKGKYIILSGDPGDLNSKTFKDGAMKFISPLVYTGDINIIKDSAIINWDPENAYTIVKEGLKASNNKVDAILAPNDTQAGAAIKALEEQGLAGKVVITGGIGDLAALQRIVKGTQQMTIFKDTRELGRIAIDSAIKLANNELVATNSSTNNGKKNIPTILQPLILITKNNLDDIFIKSGYWTKEDIYDKTSQTQTPPSH